MNLFSNDNFKVNIDIEKTKSLYYKEECYDLIYLNYVEFCKQLTNEERDFFDYFGIMPEFVCSITPESFRSEIGTRMSCGIEKDKTINYYIYYKFIGKYISIPNNWFIPIEKFLESEHNIVDRTIHIGRFSFDFEPTKSVLENSLDKVEKEEIEISCSVNTPWLLSEECKLKVYSSPKWWQIHKKLQEKIRNHRSIKRWEKEMRKGVIEDLVKDNIRYIELNYDAICAIKLKCIKEIVPVEKQKEAMELCYPKKWYFGGYLWHIFSSELVECLKEEEAKSSFEGNELNECILFLEDYNLAFRIYNNFELLKDIIHYSGDYYLIDSNFKWCYAVTHEEYLGPYFYKKQ